MSGVLTAAQVEAAALEGRRELPVTDQTIVTPLAKDRAAALGVALIELVTGSAPRPEPPGPSGSHTSRPRAGRRGDRQAVDRLAFESKVRILARRALLRRGHGLGQLEDLVAAVMTRLLKQETPGPSCGCDGGPR